VGREEFSDYPAEALEVASVGSVYGELNTEAMVELEPDLVLMSELNNPEHVDVLEGLGLRVYYLPNPLSFEELYENMLTVGVLTGHLEEAEALVDSLRARVDSVVAAVEGAEPVRVYYEVDGTDSSAPWTTGSGTFQQVLIGMSEGVNIASDIEGWGTITLEELVNRDPEVMIFAAGPFVPTTVESVAERPGWGEISAVSEGRIYAIDTNWVDRPGPRLVDALEAMGAAIHPDRFEGP
jgi:iron complex transport system substrate-binding protein